jgi:hypothetical protein
MVLVLATLLFGLSLALNGGVVVSSTRTAQNGADAAALAGADSCAWKVTALNLSGNPTVPGGYTPSPTTPPCGADGTVTVTMSKTTDVSYTFSAGSKHVAKTAKATWLTIKAVTGPFPAIFPAMCLPGALPATGITLVAVGLTSCGGTLGGSNKGYLQDGCNATITVGLPVPDNGNNLNGTGCAEGPATQPKTLEYFRTKDAFGLGVGVVPLPLRKSNAVPYIPAGFLLFKMDGWSTQGGHAGGVSFSCPTTQGMCVHGDAQVRVDIPPGFPTGSTQCFGICRVYLIQ